MELIDHQWWVQKPNQFQVGHIGNFKMDSTIQELSSNETYMDCSRFMI